MTRIIKYLAVAGLVATLAVLVLSMSLMWATHKSRERTSCYFSLTAEQDVSACGSPGAVERWLKSVFA